MDGSFARAMIVSVGLIAAGCGFAPTSARPPTIAPVVGTNGSGLPDATLVEGAAVDAAVASDHFASSYSSAPPVSLGAGFTRLDVPVDDRPIALELGSLGGADPLETIGIFGDMDGDDRPEVVLSSGVFGPVAQDPGTTVSRVHRYVDHALVAAPDLQAVLDRGHAEVASVFDLDGDGLSDILFAAPRAGEWMRGVAPGVWSDPTPIGVQPAGTLFQRSGIITFFDLDEDGWIDILETTAACGGPSATAFIRTALDRFDPVPGLFAGPWVDTDIVGAWPTPAGTVVSIFGHPCDPDLPTSGFFHATGHDASGYPVFEGYDPVPLSTEMRLGGNAPAFVNQVTPMSAAVADLDGDGRLDEIITVHVPFLPIFWGRPAGAFADGAAPLSLPSPIAHPGHSMIPWGIQAVDLDRDGLLDVVAAHGDDVGSFREQSIGPQITAAWHNVGGGHFVDATAQTFVLHGVVVDYSGASFNHGTASDIRKDARVQAKGALSHDGTRLQAQDITFSQ